MSINPPRTSGGSRRSGRSGGGQVPPVGLNPSVSTPSKDPIDPFGTFFFFFFFFLNQQFITWCSIAVCSTQYKLMYCLRVYRCKIVRDTATLTSPFRAVMSPACTKRRQENDKENWALRRLPKPALAPDVNHPRHVQSTPRDVPSRSRTRVYLAT
jgi:hypothetical protein